MKKTFSLIGALFLGASAFAQVSKTDSTNKTGSRKVTAGDVKDLPADDGHTTGTGMSKGRTGGFTQKSNAQDHVIKGTGASITEKMGAGSKEKSVTDSAAQKSSNYHMKMPSQKN